MALAGAPRWSSSASPPLLILNTVRLLFTCSHVFVTMLRVYDCWWLWMSEELSACERWPSYSIFIPDPAYGGRRITLGVCVLYHYIEPHRVFACKNVACD